MPTNESPKLARVDQLAEEALRLAYAFAPEHCASWEEKAVDELAAAIKALRTAALAQAEGEPVAWMTHHDEPMLFPTHEEAASYCDDDEEPIALYAAPPAHQVPELTLEMLERTLQSMPGGQKGFRHQWGFFQLVEAALAELRSQQRQEKT